MIFYCMVKIMAYGVYIPKFMCRLQAPTLNLVRLYGFRHPRYGSISKECLKRLPDSDACLEKSNSHLVKNKYSNFFEISPNREECSSTSLIDRPVSSKIADKILNQLLLQEEAKE